jgi:hypothetical protein
MLFRLVKQSERPPEMGTGLVGHKKSLQSSIQLPVEGNQHCYFLHKETAASSFTILD